MRDIKNKKIKILGNILTVFSIVYIIFTIKKMNLSFTDIYNKFNFILLISVGSIITLAGLFINSYGWKIILDFFSNKIIKVNDIWPIYLKSNLGKYLPGNIMQYVERNLFAAELGISQIFIALSSVIESGLLVLSAFLLTFLFSYQNVTQMIKKMVNFKLWIVLFGICICFIIALVIFYKYSNKIKKIWNEIRQGKSLKNIIAAIVKLICIYSFAFVANGICYALICKNMFDVNLDIKQFCFLIISFIIAWVIGFIVPGAPGGIGVREFVLILLGESIIGTNNIYIAVLVQRIISVIGDVLGYLMAAIRIKLL